MTTRYSIFFAVMALVLVVAACGGGTQVAEGGIGGTGVAQGRITGFGSVYVNGVKYDTSAATVTVEGLQAAENALAVGMVVTVEGSVNSDGVTGTAETIRYADDIDGIVQANGAATGGSTLTVMGQTVVLRPDTVFPRNADIPSVTAIADIPVGAIVEVSGYADGAGSVYAARIELKSDAWQSGEEIGVKGVVSGLDTVGRTFMLGGLTVDYSGAYYEQLADGDYVEVKSRTGFDGQGRLTASEVEPEGEGYRGFSGEEGDEVEIEGIVTDVSGLAGGELGINGQTVRIADRLDDDSEVPDPTWLGRRVEVEGQFSADGVLVGDEFEIESDATELAELAGYPVITVDGLTLMGRPILTDTATLFADEATGLRSFGLDDITATDLIEVYGKATSEGILAVEVVREVAESGAAWELEGTIEAVPDSTTVVVAGVTAYLDQTEVRVDASHVGARMEMDGTFSGGVFTAVEAGIGDS